ncbi:MAG: hypothetical protein AB8B73_05710 [Ekhidna sp.]
MKVKHFLSALAFISVLTSIAQTQTKHEPKIFRDSIDRVHVNMELPVYLSISSTPDGSDSQVLKGQDPKYSYPMFLDTEGYNSIRSPWKVNPETKETVYPKEDVVFEVYADSKAPISKMTFASNKKNVEGGKVAVGDGKVTLVSEDALSGVQSIYYSIDKAPYQKYSMPFSLEEKEYNIQYYAVDNVGNIEEVKEINLYLDKTAPATEMTVDGDLSETVLSSRSTIKLDASDKSSEILKTYYSIDEGRKTTYVRPISLTTLSEGEHTISYFSEDILNNAEDKNTYTFFLDKSAPRVIDEIIGNTFISNGKEYYSGKTKLKLVSLDNKSGVKEVRYSVNGGEFKLYEDPFYLTQSGALSIELLAIDKVNNKARIDAFSDKSNMRSFVDLSGPELDYSLTGPSFKVKDTVYISERTKISLTGKDAEAGFKEIDYQVGSSSSSSYSDPLSIKEEGFHKITYNGYDNLQNSNTSNIFCLVDNTGPEVFSRFSIETSKTKTIDGKTVSVYPPHVVLFLSATDRYAGLDKISYQINGSSNQPYRSLIEDFARNKLYTIVVSVSDKLGNSNEKEVQFYIE